VGHWHDDDTALLGLKCDFHPRCKFCDTELKVFSTGLLDFALDKSKKKDRSHALDVNFMCPNCGYLDIFGVAISEKHWARILELLAKMSENHQVQFYKDAKVYKGDRNVTEGVVVEKTPAWKRTGDVKAHEPMFPINCFHCGKEMSLRHTTLHFHDDGRDQNELNQVAYKCAECGWFVRFNVIDDTSYLKEIHEKYRKKKVHTPSKEEWSDEDKEKARQLEALGYWGGR
jgi:uncharacterized Zn finger protein